MNIYEVHLKDTTPYASPIEITAKLWKIVKWFDSELCYEFVAENNETQSSFPFASVAGIVCTTLVEEECDCTCKRCCK
jgi:hypothetical protein